VLSGSVRIGRDTLVGVGASVRQGITIGSGVVVGAGAAVVHDVADGLTVLGAPARPVDVER
jgi:acetyltransferase-like isoleucine patch superfamily enzyme